MQVRSYGLAILVTLAAVSMNGSVHATSDTVTYQGVLIDNDGAAVPDGTYALTFQLWDVAIDGAVPLWEEAHASVAVTGGVFTTVLGEIVPFGDLFATNAELYLEVRADLGNGEMGFAPRVPITAAPHALHAHDSDRFEGQSAAMFTESILDHFRGEAAFSTDSGGQSTLAFDNFATVSGGNGNQAGTFDGDPTSAQSATVGGGSGNSATAPSATVAGGSSNTSEGQSSFVGGGQQNEASGSRAVVAGGLQNAASGGSSSIGGGSNNVASGVLSTIGGGIDNVASGAHSTIAGGSNNLASGNYSFAAGRDCNAWGDYSFAAGLNAYATHDGAFCWADSTGDRLNSRENQFRARASGGFLFFTDPDHNVFAWLQSGSGSWTSNSDREQKRAIEPVDADEVLEKVAELPIAEWSYKTQDGVRHMGPMAQDFHAAFGLGNTEKGIATVDADGVALAAIQGLNEKVETLTKTLQARTRALEERERELSALQRQVDEMSAVLDRLITIETE